MISEIKHRIIDGENKIDSFIISDAQNNIIEFRRSCPDVYVGSIPEIKHLKLVLLALMHEIRKKIKISIPVIDIKFDPQIPSEGIITIYNQSTANVLEGNIIINEDIAFRTMQSEEQMFVADAAAIPNYNFNFFNFFRNSYVFDIGLLGSNNNGLFELKMKNLTLDNEHISFKMKMELISLRCYKLIFIMIIALFVIIYQTYQQDIYNYLVNVYENYQYVPPPFRFY